MDLNQLIAMKMQGIDPMQGVMGAQPPMAPMGALQPGMMPPPEMAPPMPDYQAIMQPPMAAQLPAPMAPPAMAAPMDPRMRGRELLGQWLRSKGMRPQQQPGGMQPLAAFGGGGMQPPAPPVQSGMQPPSSMQQPTQPANVATLPGGGMQSAFGGGGWGQRQRMNAHGANNLQAY